jgi:hypothetical protein
LLAIDWTNTQLATDADALALWERIAPTGEDWDEKLEEVPGDGPIGEQLGLALLRSGNFTCVPAQQNACARVIDVPEPAANATLADPCLRRLLALWSIGQLDEDNLAPARDALRAIVALPPPESELVAAALKAPAESDQAARIDLLAIAFRAGHRDLVNGELSMLDDPVLIEAGQKHHIDGAFNRISAASHRAAFIAAITDEQLHPEARVQAISELIDVDNKLANDVRVAVVRATRSPNCEVAAAAARFLVRNGEKKFAPAKPRTTKPAAMMRGLCVLASYEAGLRADEPSFLLGYVTKKGIELITVKYDEYNDVDTDGDGDPKTEKSATVVPRDEVTLPEPEDLVRALAHCSGTTCRSDDREFRFGFKPVAGELLLNRIEVIDRPPCNKRGIPNP